MRGSVGKLYFREKEGSIFWKHYTERIMIGEND